jgi:hypothetical protein
MTTLTPCQQDDDNGELWFSTDELDIIEAKGMCFNHCPARQACLDLALTAEGGKGTDSRFGIFGGLTPRQRRQLAKHGPAPEAPCGTPLAYARHRRRQEPPCHACCTAEAARAQERKARRKQRANAC